VRSAFAWCCRYTSSPLPFNELLEIEYYSCWCRWLPWCWRTSVALNVSRVGDCWALGIRSSGNIPMYVFKLNRNRQLAWMLQESHCAIGTIWALSVKTPKCRRYHVSQHVLPSSRQPHQQ
jgi:hypothetical protein